jgi:hypothetical protein
MPAHGSAAKLVARIAGNVSLRIFRGLFGGTLVQTANSFGFLLPFDCGSILTSHMRIALLILCAVIGMAIIAYWSSFPLNSFFIFSRPGGGSMTLSRTGVSFQSAPDHYASNGFDHLQPYIAKLEPVSQCQSSLFAVT